jgi:DNA-binding NarL/FixJ family response regulator
MHDEALYAKQAFRAGAAGYITKHEAAETIISGIRMMLSGREYISESITQKLLKKMHSKRSHD